MKASAGICAAAVGLLALAGCATGGKVMVLTEGPAVPLGHSYAWQAMGQGQHGSPLVDNDIIRGRIESSANRVLQAKGYHMAAPASADVLIAYHIGLQQKTETRVDQAPSMGVPTGMVCGRQRCATGWGWGYYGPPETSVRTYDYIEGSLIIDAVDRASGKLVWRALYREKIDTKSAEPARIDRVIDNAMKTLPAAAG